MNVNARYAYFPNMYRTPEEIEEDIRAVREKISSINESINARELISGLMDCESEDELPSSAERLSEVLMAAIEALDELRALGKILDELKAELIEVIYMNGD